MSYLYIFLEVFLRATVRIPLIVDSTYIHLDRPKQKKKNQSTEKHFICQTNCLDCSLVIQYSILIQIDAFYFIVHDIIKQILCGNHCRGHHKPEHCYGFAHIQNYSFAL
jgi:hypothetical protein